MLDNQESINAVGLHDSLAADWEQKYSLARFRRRSDAFFGLLKNLPTTGQVWLDGGCGTGNLSRRMRDSGAFVIGVDGSGEMLKVAQALCTGERETGALFVRIENIENLPLPDAVFDGIICSSVIEYLSKPDVCLREFHRVLKPGGLLLISAPNKQSVLRRILKLAHKLTGFFFPKPWPYYLAFSINEYSLNDLTERLGAAGLNAMEATYFSPCDVGGLMKAWMGSLIICMAKKSEPG